MPIELKDVVSTVSVQVRLLELLSLVWDPLVDIMTVSVPPNH